MKCWQLNYLILLTYQKCCLTKPNAAVHLSTWWQTQLLSQWRNLTVTCASCFFHLNLPFLSSNLCTTTSAARDVFGRWLKLSAQGRVSLCGQCVKRSAQRVSQCLPVIWPKSDLLTIHSLLLNWIIFIETSENLSNRDNF